MDPYFRTVGFWAFLAIPTISCAAHGATEPTDQRFAQREAEARAAIAQPERAELLACLPPSSARPLQGSVDAGKFGAAGLVKAFDLARELAVEVWAALPDGRKTAIYEPTRAQGILAARLVQDAIERLKDDLNRQNKELQYVIETHTLQGSAAAIAFTLLTAVPATLKAGTDSGPTSARRS